MSQLSLRVAALAAGAALLTGTLSTSAQAAPAPADNPREVSLQRVLDQVVAAGATSATARVDDRGHRIQVSSGVAERGTDKRVPRDAKFRAGSVTKALIGTVVLQLVAHHRLHLDDALGQHLPGLVPAGQDVTVRQLLSHTSGITDFLTTFPPAGTQGFVDLRTSRWTPRQLVDRIADAPLEFSPGTKASYSNTNFVLLALMIERVTGHPYEDVVTQRILKPLEMHDTSFPRRAHLPRPHARGYMPVEAPDGSSRMVDVTTFEPSIMWGGGELASTTRDLNRFLGSLLRGHLLPPHLMRAMRTTALDSKYGLGIIREELSCGITVWGKDGDAPGYSTWSFSTPDASKRAAISITSGTGDPDDAVRRALDTALCR